MLAGGTASAKASTGTPGRLNTPPEPVAGVRALFESYKSLTIFTVSVATVVTFLISSRM